MEHQPFCGEWGAECTCYGDELKRAQERNADLLATLAKIRERCTYSDLITGERQPRLVLHGKDIVALVDAALREE